jgi:type III secretion apparatus needle protein
LRAALNALSGSPTQAQMIEIQYEVQSWGFFIQLTSTMQKEMADAFKGILAKI